jgi:hypothetical protein
MMADLQFLYHFSNTFDSDESTTDCPAFLRHHGIKGQLRILSALENNIEKVKLVLKGKYKYCRVETSLLSVELQESSPTLSTTDAIRYIGSVISDFSGS